MAQSLSTEAFGKGTGRSWSKWLEVLEANGASNLGHKALAQLALEHMPPVGNPGWWAQSVAIAYEQASGGRVAGQLSDGTFAANASRTLVAILDGALERWIMYVGNAWAGEPARFNGALVTQPPTTSGSEKWRYWRCTVNETQRINVTIKAKPGGKVTLAVQHPGLATAGEREEWQNFWKSFLKELPA